MSPNIWPFGRTPEPDAGHRIPAAADEAARTQIEALVAALPDPVLLVDGDGLVLAANARMRAALDTDPVGHHLSTSIRTPALLDAVAEATSVSAGSNVEHEIRVPVPRSFDVTVSPLARDGRTGPAAVLVFKDLTREQQIERMRADFVANASHELRTPLAALSGFIETMQGAARSDESARERFLGLMRQQADRMKRLIDDLLSLSRIEINEHVRPTARADLAQIARQAGEAMKNLADELGCPISLAVDQPLPVTGDADELLQVVQNLVENALKYASSGGRIEIEGQKVNGHVELTIRDHGPGIAAEHLPRLTERFYRVSVQESRLRGGTGLGLAIVKHILNRHRGRLLISSEMGRGSAFTIRIPI